MPFCTIIILNTSYQLQPRDAAKIMAQHFHDLKNLIAKNILYSIKRNKEYIDYKCFKTELAELVGRFDSLVRVFAWSIHLTKDQTHVDACLNLLETVKRTPAQFIFPRLLLRQLDALPEDDVFRLYLTKKTKSNDLLSILTLSTDASSKIWLRLNLLLCKRIIP